MRLYLSSYGIGDRAGALLALLGNGKRAAVIANALDLTPRAARIAHEEIGRSVDQLAALGIAASELDLRDFFGRRDALAERLAAVDLIWATGGNVFVLRRAMKQSGFDDIVSAMLDRDAIVYGGFSAGAAVAALSLRGLELMHDPLDLPDGYAQGEAWEGLGLVDFSIVPHYRSDRAGPDGAERVSKRLARQKLPFRVLRDGEAIVWTGARTARRLEAAQ